MRTLGLLEIFLLELAVYLVLWLVNDYLASILSLVAAGVLLAALLLALAAEGIERSKVPRRFFAIMVLSIIAPLLVGAVFFVLNGPPSWLAG